MDEKHDNATQIRSKQAQEPSTQRKAYQAPRVIEDEGLTTLSLACVRKTVAT